MLPTDLAGGLAVVELRQYTLRPGRRDGFIELFDREFVETQEETGMAVLGQFRDLGDPDRFVCATVWSFPPGRPDGVVLIRDGILPGIERKQTTPPRMLRLAPTSRSRIR